MKKKEDLQTIRNKKQDQLTAELLTDRKELIKGSNGSNMHSARLIRTTIARKLTIIKEMDLVQNENKR